MLQEFKGLFFIAFFFFAGRTSGNGNGIIPSCFTAQRYPGAAGEGGKKTEKETVLSDIVLLRRDILEPPGKAGRKGGN